MQTTIIEDDEPDQITIEDRRSTNITVVPEGDGNGNQSNAEDDGNEGLY